MQPVHSVGVCVILQCMVTLFHLTSVISHSRLAPWTDKTQQVFNVQQTRLLGVPHIRSPKENISSTFIKCGQWQTSYYLQDIELKCIHPWLTTNRNHGDSGAPTIIQNGPGWTRVLRRNNISVVWTRACHEYWRHAFTDFPCQWKQKLQS